jgi:BolA protein
MTPRAPAPRDIAALRAGITAALEAALHPDSMDLQDDSAQHAGHAGASAGAHFTLRITAAAFAGRPRVARHRLVYDSLHSWMAPGGGIHALAIDARAPGETFEKAFEKVPDPSSSVARTR